MNDPQKKKLRLGVLGAGGIARRRVLPALKDSSLLEVCAVMDTSGAREIAREFGVPRHYEDQAALIADPGVDAVYIATPVHHHAAQIQAVAAAGKPMLCEKPVARTFEETRASLEFCRRHEVLFMEGFMMNFHGAHRAMRDLIRGGAIGRPVSMRAQLSCWYPPLEGAWRQNPELGGGGALMDMATHCFSLLEFLTGDRITGVFAMTSSQVHDYASEDSATTLLVFSGGCHATVDSFFCVRDESSANRLEVYGDEGSILAQGTIGQSPGGTVEMTSVKNTVYDSSQAGRAVDAYRPVPFPTVNPYAAQMEYFAECVLGGVRPEINGEAEAGHIARVTAGAYRSWKDKRFIGIPPCE